MSRWNISRWLFIAWVVLIAVAWGDANIVRPGGIGRETVPSLVFYLLVYILPAWLLYRWAQQRRARRLEGQASAAAQLEQSEEGEA